MIARGVRDQPKYLSFLVVFYVTALLLTMFVENRLIYVFGFKVLSGTLVIPLIYLLSDMITEVYGYQEMRKVIWISIIMLYIVAGLLDLVMMVPSSHDVTSRAYSIVFKPFQRDVMTYSVAAVLSIFLNSYILSKWKILIEGRLFWMRSLCSTGIGELVFILTWGFLGFYGVFPFKTLVSILVFSYIYKIICNLVMITPSAIIVGFLKRSENIDAFDLNTRFNPFRFHIQDESTTKQPQSRVG